MLRLSYPTDVGARYMNFLCLFLAGHIFFFFFFVKCAGKAKNCYVAQVSVCLVPFYLALPISVLADDHDNNICLIPKLSMLWSENLAIWLKKSLKCCFVCLKQSGFFFFSLSTTILELEKPINKIFKPINYVATKIGSHCCCFHMNCRAGMLALVDARPAQYYICQNTNNALI